MTKGFKMVGTDKFKEARILELENHPFFIATLFVPAG
jgi:CTP synthase (UTP-ammonia lyase)